MLDGYKGCVSDVRRTRHVRMRTKLRVAAQMQREREFLLRVVMRRQLLCSVVLALATEQNKYF